MRISYLCSDYGISLGKMNGPARHISGILGALQMQGHEILYVSADDPAVLPGDWKTARLPKRGELSEPTAEELHRYSALPDHDDPVSIEGDRPDVWINLAVERTLLKVLPPFRPDVIVDRISLYSVAGGGVARQLGIPHVLHVNAPIAWEARTYRGLRLPGTAEALERQTLEQASRVVVVSQEMKELLTRSGIEGGKIEIVQTGVDAELFAASGPNQRDGLDGKFVIGFTGSLKPWHGIDVLTDAFRQLAEDPRFHLLVLGDGPLRKILVKLERKYPGRVTCPGAVPLSEVPAWVRTMDVAVAPYPDLETFYFSPLKVMEYMAAGRAIVASRIGQLVRIIEEGQTGLLVPPGDAGALATALRGLADDPDLTKRIGAEAALEARRRHTWGHRAAALTAVLTRAGAGEPQEAA